MCSISWQTQLEGYDLFFNRDEQRDRALADPPKRFLDSAGRPYLAPIDPQGGGTWIFLNAYGLTAALLNAYDVNPPVISGKWTSRGQLLRSLTHTPSVGRFETELRALLKFGTYPPCYLFVIDRKQTVGFWRWNGETLETIRAPALQFFTTSSFHPEEIRTKREQAFRKALGEPAHDLRKLEAFHLDAHSNLTASDIRMTRLDARTVSYTRVSLRKNNATMRYLPRRGDEEFSAPKETTLLEKTIKDA